MMRRASRINLTNVRRGLRGVGLGADCMSVDEIRAQLPQMQNCDGHDTACVLCNQQIDAAIENFQIGGCLPPGTPLSFSCNTSQAAIDAFQNNTPLAPVTYAGGVLDTGRPANLPPGVAPDGTTLGVALPGGGFTSSLPAGYQIPTNAPGVVPAAAPVVVQSSAPPVNPAPSVGSSAPPVGSAAGSTGGAATTAIAAASSGFDLSGIPSWGYLAAAGLVAFLVLGGKR